MERGGVAGEQKWSIHTDPRELSHRRAATFIQLHRWQILRLWHREDEGEMRVCAPPLPLPLPLPMYEYLCTSHSCLVGRTHRRSIRTYPPLSFLSLKYVLFSSLLQARKSTNLVKSESASDSPFGLKWKVWESKETGFNIDANLSVVVWPTTTEENAAVRNNFFSFLLTSTL